MITDTFLNNMAAVLNGSSFSIPTHNAFSSTSITQSPTASTLTGESLTRVTLTPDTVVNRTNFTGLRSGAVASSSGNIVNAIGLFTASSSGTLLATALVPSVLHTSSFDLSVDWGISVNRR